jgi:hypothetical protein
VSHRERCLKCNPRPVLSARNGRFYVHHPDVVVYEAAPVPRPIRVPPPPFNHALMRRSKHHANMPRSVAAEGP